MTASAAGSRGRTWFAALAGGAEPIATGLESVLVADPVLGGELVRLLALVPDPANRFPCARHGELGLDEGWALARHVREALAADRSGAKRPIIAIVDVKSQAYGRLESLLGIHLSLAAAVDAYAAAPPGGASQRGPGRGGRHFGGTVGARRPGPSPPGPQCARRCGPCHGQGSGGAGNAPLRRGPR